MDRAENVLREMNVDGIPHSLDKAMFCVVVLLPVDAASYRSVRFNVFKL